MTAYTLRIFDATHGGWVIIRVALRAADRPLSGDDEITEMKNIPPNARLEVDLVAGNYSFNTLIGGLAPGDPC